MEAHAEREEDRHDRGRGEPGGPVEDMAELVGQVRAEQREREVCQVDET
jgi:hypothetical protein